MYSTRFLLALFLIGGAAFAGEPKRDRFGDPLPEGAVARLGTINAHPGVRSIAFSADGKELRTVGTSSVREWDMSTGRIKRIVSIPHTVRHPVEAERRPERISEDGRVGVRIVGKQIEVVELQPFKVRHRAATKDDCVCAVSPNGHWAILTNEYPGYANFEVRILNLESGKSEKWKDFTGSPYEFVFSPDSKLVAASLRSKVGGIQCRHLSTGRLQVLGTDDSTPLAFSADSKRIVVARFEYRTLEVWDLEKEKRVSPSGMKSGDEYGWVAVAAALNSDGSILATSRNKQIAIWDVATAKKIGSWQGSALCLAFSPDGKRLAASNELVQIWDVGTGKPLLPDFGPLVGLVGGDFPVFSNSADNRLVAWSRYAGRACLWNYSTGTAIRSYRIDHYCIHRVWLSPDGNRFISIDDPALLTMEGDIRRVKVRVWDAASGAEVSQFLPIPPAEKRIFKPVGLQVVDSGRIIALAMKHDDSDEKGPGLFVRWDIKAKKLVDSFRFPLPEDAYKVEVELTGHGALHGGYQFDRDCPNGRRILLPQNGDDLDSINDQICADGRLMLADTQSTNPTVFEMASGRPMLQVPKVKDIHYWTHHLAVSPDGRWLALSRFDLIELWDIVEGKRVPFHKPHRITEYSDPEENYCCDLLFLPDGKHLIAAHGDGTALVWELPQEALKPPSQRMTARIWDDLASIDARVGYNAVWAMWNEPEKALALLKEKLKPATLPPAKELAAWIEELGEKEYSKREEAMKRLRAYGQTIGSTLRKAASQAASAEQKRRLNELLSGYHSVASRTPEEIRAIRCVQVLEKLKGPGAKQLLRELAKGELSAILTQEAKKATQ